MNRAEITTLLTIYSVINAGKIGLSLSFIHTRTLESEILLLFIKH